MSPETLRRSMTARDVAIRVGMYTEHGEPNEQGVYRMARQNVIPHYRIARLIRFDEAAIDAWIASGGSK